MKLEFNIQNVTVTEFGVGRDTGAQQAFVTVPVDTAVQAVLREMVQATWDALQKDEDGPSLYEPSEKHGSTEYLYLPLGNDLASAVRELHDAKSLSIDTHVLADPSDVFCYFTRLTDNSQRRLTAVRRASQFKGVLKSRNRLVRMLDDTLQIIEDTVFKLDSDFDLIVDSSSVHILRPSGFEFAGKLQQAILEAVPQNVARIQKELAFVAFEGIGQYVGKHPRAARYLASICAQKETTNIDKALLKRLCKQTGIEVAESKGTLTVADGHEMGFLEVLDRRRYEVSLVKEKPEQYRAASRRKING